MFDTIKEEVNSNTIGGIIKNQMLKYIMVNGSFLINDLSRITGYSLTTIMKYVATMQEDGYVIPLGKVQNHSKGRQSVRYGVNPDSCYFIGVDIKNFELSIGLMNFIGEMIDKKNYTDFQFENTHQTLDMVCNTIQDFIAEHNEIDQTKILDICINLSGRVNSSAGTSASVFNFEEMQDTPLAELLSEKLSKKVFIENDTKAMAYGEYLSGLNKKFKNLIYVNIGWGLGIGIIIYGKIYYGMDGYSGELGHVHMYDNNVMCHCGKKGCIETEVSGSAIHRKLMQRIKDGEISLLSHRVKDGNHVTIRDIIDAAEKEDPMAIELIEQTGLELGHQLAGLINLFNPEAIVIGGTLSSSDPNYFIQSIELAIRKYSLKLMSQKVEILTSELKNEAGLIGACMIARARIFNDFE